MVWIQILRHGTILLAALSLMALTGCANYGDSVRILTLNAQFLPGSDDDKTRPIRIADKIKESDYDIVIFQEVFDGEAELELRAALSGRFPHYVSYLGDDAVGTQDSGLMLFSRFPFETLPNDEFQAEDDDVDASNDGVDWKDVAFIEYEQHSWPDTMAAKGIAMVRIRNPHTDRVYNVAFTHMQASYPEDEETFAEWLEPIIVRKGQFYDIERLIDKTLSGGMFGREDTFVFGDLNVDGDQNDEDLGSTAMGQDRPNLYEWVEHFDTIGRFFTEDMKDAWAREQSFEDRGLTNLYHWGPNYAPDQGARLDYFLRNRPSSDEPLCVQHMTLAHNLRDGTPEIESGFGMAGPNELSDHIGINVDLNLEAPRCNVDLAAVPTSNAWVAGEIVNPGNVQWFLIKDAGTYAFSVDGKNMRYRVYSGKDMSTPLPQYYEETITFTPIDSTTTVTGEKYVLPDPPYFVKVSKRQRSLVGEYRFVSHRATCASKEEACAIRAYEPVTEFLSNLPVNPDDTLWYDIRTQVADSGVAQELGFLVDNYSLDRLELTLLADDGTTVLAQDIIAEPDPINVGFLQLRIPTNDPGPSKFYLNVKRPKFYLNVKRHDLSLYSFRVGWETNLTILHGQSIGIPGSASANLYCVVETDGVLDEDEIWLTVEADGVTIVDDEYIGQYDDGDYRTMEDYFDQINYIDEIKVTLREEDGGLSGEDDFLTATISTLSKGKTESLNEVSSLSCCDGTYLLRYNRSRNLNK